MKAFLIFSMLITLSAASTLYYAYNCSEGTTHFIGTRKEIYDQSSIIAGWLLNRRIFKELDPATGLFNGSVIIAHNDAVYRHTCIKTFIDFRQEAGKCFYGGTTRARTESGQTTYVGQDAIFIKKASRVQCPRSWPKAHIQQSIENEHASSSIAQARHRLPLEDLSNIFNLDSALDNLELMLETGADRNETATADTRIQRFYKRFVSPITTYYTFAYVIYTTALTSVALGLRIPIFRAVKLGIPCLRRLGDILSYRRDLIMQRQAEKLRQIRRLEGLDEPPPIMDYTLGHFQNIYSALIVINERLDKIAPQPSDYDSDSEPTRSPSPSPTPTQAKRQMRSIQPRPSPRQHRPNPGRARRVSGRAARTSTGRYSNEGPATRAVRF